MIVTPDKIADDHEAILTGIRLLPEWARRKFCCYQASLAILMHGVSQEREAVFNAAHLLIESGLSGFGGDDRVAVEGCLGELRAFLDESYDSLGGLIRARAECYEKTLDAMLDASDRAVLRSTIWSYEAVEHLGFIEVCGSAVGSRVVSGEQYLTWMKNAESTRPVETYLRMIDGAYSRLMAGVDVNALIY